MNILRPVCRIATALALAITPVLALTSQPALAASPTTMTINNVWSTSKTPTVSISMPTACTDLSLYIYDDAASVGETDSHTVVLISAYDAGFTNDGNGNWSVDLSATNNTLPNGYYNIYASTQCGNGSSGDPKYDDSKLDALYIVPVGCTDECRPVHRFYNYIAGVHFYTSNEDEKRTVMYEMYDTYRYEGVASFSHSTATNGAQPVYRFYNKVAGVHFYTNNNNEANNVRNNLSYLYRDEGVAYYSNTTQVANTVPVYRFYNYIAGVHFYTSNQAEATSVYNNLGYMYRTEGIASYNIENK